MQMGMENSPMLSHLLSGVAHSGVIAAGPGEGASELPWLIYMAVGVAVVVGIIALLKYGRRAGLSGSSGDDRGPRPGTGAVVHHLSGEADFDGSSGATLHPKKDPILDLPYPPEKSAD